ncbi:MULTISPECIES: MATE family efflux transporter [Micromonospora]|uniref:MATE family efflux transporter n=2 Tax=Micromonospora chalcea TaxID=1874 RepID=A0ABX9Y0B3_MICCH|nr:MULTISPECIES: MATE family efflux transporter [Micromonospora]MBC8993837.1 MATE family efflux transporter [Micromonospora chalcea]MBQ1059967.1 MATE family efflux transporter [Micromonospora sp. C41]MCK1809713.1 MATE family efflux transporter [Micromonospora sp. R42106]MCK1834749.1 MATE family efflux transporter [Micromonospora sp. R42003]MCK1846629.1 MATE family efflux transporter [Micromonospora sp. R42004]
MSTTAAPATAATPRRIATLALPALVVLAAEPLYVLVDTAVVGHLGRVPLAALAVGGTVMTLTAWVGTVVAYGTTGRSARRFGAGDRAAAVAEGVQASWLALATGVLVAVAIGIGGGALARTLVGGPGEVADAAAGWLRVAALGAPGLLLAAAGNGWLRGIQDTRRPLLFVLGPNLLSAVLCPLLVYPAGLGLVGSAVANAIAQTLSGVLFAAALVRERVSLRPRPRVIGQQLVLSRDLLVRGVAFQASFLSATAVAARFGAAAVGAHQIALQLWFFTVLVLDALAIAAQSLVGAALGGGDAAGARFLARRVALLGGLCGVAFAVLIAAGAGVVPSWFSSDPQVREQAMTAWPWFVALQPIGGVVFALDGVLIGAGDVRYLRNLTIVCAFGGFLPAIWLAYGLELGLGGIWAGLTLFVVLRLAGLLLRMRSGAWAVVGAVR